MDYPLYAVLRVLEGHRSYSWWNIRNVQVTKSTTPPRIVPQTGPSGILYTESDSKSDDSHEDGAFPIPVTIGAVEIASGLDDDRYRDPACSWPAPPFPDHTMRRL